MYSEDTQTRIRAWANEAFRLHADFLRLLGPIGADKRWTADERQTLFFYLSPACERSTQSALFLIAYGQLWDAEVIVRSIAEGTLKFCYLLQSQTTFEQRHREYSHDLFQIALLKDHRKAEELLSAIPNPSDPEWQPIRNRLLKCEEFDKISREYPQAARRALDSRWGFTGLMSELNRSGDKAFSGSNGLAHGYSIASHVQHADYVGTSLPMDRDLRSNERRNSIQLAHAARLISDTFSYMWLRLAVAYRFLAHDTASLVQAQATTESLMNDLDAAANA
ncbi:MAG: hypothetical protein JSR47_11630 [Proteobacteria bacterium]|nr:hypothetical protein [Pseudomonadota bacterium]MBS0550316.1 hypothetical protein [Pseudomonadota bacterium]